MIDPLAVDERRVAEAARLEGVLGKDWWLPKPGEPLPGDRIMIVVVQAQRMGIATPAPEPFVELAMVIDRREANVGEDKFGCVVGDWNPGLNGRKYVCEIEWEGWAWCRGWDIEDAVCLIATWHARQVAAL